MAGAAADGSVVPPPGIASSWALDRLAFIGDRAMGALRFVPATDPHAVEPDWSLLALAGKASGLWLERRALPCANWR